MSTSVQTQWLDTSAMFPELQAGPAARPGQLHSMRVDNSPRALFQKGKILAAQRGCGGILLSITRLSCSNAVVSAIAAPHIYLGTSAIMEVHDGGRPSCLQPILEIGLPDVDATAHATGSELGRR